MLAEVAPVQLRRTVFIPFTFFFWPLSWICPGVGDGVAVGVAVGEAVGVGVGVPPPPAGSWSKKVFCCEALLIGTRPSSHEVTCVLGIAEP